MVKKLTALSLAIFMVVVLAACGSNGTNANSGNANGGAAAESTESATTESASSSKVVIKYWYAFGDKIEEAKQHLVKEFNESQDKI